MRINKICQQRESCMNRSKSRYTIGNFDIKDYIKIIIISNIFLTVVKIICIPILQTMYLNIDDIQISIRFNFKNFIMFVSLSEYLLFRKDKNYDDYLAK